MASQARLAFIGTGIMGQDLLKQAVENPKATVAALCDVDPDTLDKAATLCPSAPATYDDHTTMLREGEFDGVVVAVPQHLHARLTIDALDAGCATFCEKPMGMNVRECEAMIAAAKRNGKELMIGQVLQYLGVYRYMLELAQSGDLGKPAAMRTIRTMGRWDTYWGKDWRLKKETCGGTLFEINVHEIDLMLRILGPATSVSAVGKHLVNDEIDYEDFISANITFANGGLGSVTSSQCDYLGKNNAELYLDKGTVYYDSLSQKVYIHKDGGERLELPYGEIHPEWENGLYREIREFVETCLGEHPATIPGEDGMAAVEIAEAAYLSAREGRTVQLPLPRERMKDEK